MVQVSSFIFLKESPYTFALLVGKQMVDTLIESQSNVELLLQFFDIFLKMKGLTTSEAFQEFDTNKDGFISPKEFRRAMEAQKMYTK
jgi:ryanodine receptor 2